jgi:tRNA pseudouridine38/39 synthase
LIKSESECRYSKCGRTDRGVSALGNVFALRVRNIQRKGSPPPAFLPYCSMLNRHLPKDIRILGYTLVPEYFDARFSCIYREYKYFFNPETMDLTRMALAARKLIGTHDFRNFCKKDESQQFDENEE